MSESSTLSLVDRDSLIMSHLYLVPLIVSKMRLAWAYSGSHDREDFESIATIAMIEATTRWNPNREGAASFHTYVWIRMRGAILDELRHRDLAGRNLREKPDEHKVMPRQVSLDRMAYNLASDQPSSCDLTVARVDLHRALARERAFARRVATDYWEKGLRLREIGAALGVTESYISQEFKKTRKRLGQRMGLHS